MKIFMKLVCIAALVFIYTSAASSLELPGSARTSFGDDEKKNEERLDEQEDAIEKENKREDRLDEG